MRTIVIAWVVLNLLQGQARAAADEDRQKVATAVEALTRLQNVNLDEKPAIQAAVLRLLDRTRGTPDFLRLVQHFKLTNQTAGLLDVAIKNPNDESGVAAARLALAGDDLKPIASALAATNLAETVPLVQALGNARDRKAVSLLEPLVADEQKDIEVRRAAVTALAQTQDGSLVLLRMAKQEKLPDNLKFLAASQLNGSRWPEIKTEAAAILPLPPGQNAQPLPPTAELLRLKGDSARGAEIYRRETAGCIKCHPVRGEGREVGPALSEIGSKLPKEALLEAILDPSSGISFGFEAWQVELKSGDEAYGLKASETAEEIAIKDINGIVTRYKKSEVVRMTQSKTSIMPAGLQQSMTTQELADLIEYLASLKKPAGP
jgi:putative heme-binding domain-containing protein